MFASVPSVDSHIPMDRMMQLRAEAVIVDEREADHLRQCNDCRTLLSRLAEERSRSLIDKVRSRDDDTFSKSA